MKMPKDSIKKKKNLVEQNRDMAQNAPIQQRNIFHNIIMVKRKVLSHPINLNVFLFLKKYIFDFLLFLPCHCKCRD